MIMMAYRRLMRGVLPICIVLAAPAAAVEDLTIEDAVRLARENNPRIQAARSDVRAATAREKQASALANPEIVVTPGISGRAPSDEELFLSQPLEINGTRRARTRVARGETGAVRAAAAITEREVIRDTKLAYWDAALAQAAVDMHRENVSMVESLAAAAKRQVEVGALPGSQAIKAEVELARAQQDFTAAESELSQARLVLNNIMGLRQVEHIRLTDSPSREPTDIDEERLCAAALDNRPEMAEALSKVDSLQGQLESAKAVRRPDVALQARRETFGGDGGFAVSISAPILDWGGSRAGVAAAEESISAEELRLDSVRNAVTLDVRLAVTRMMESQNLVKRYDEQILSQSEHLVQLAERGYAAGATGYLEALEAQRTLREVRLAHIRALTNLAKAKAELEWAAAMDAGSGVEESR